MSKEREKAELGAATLKDFCESYGSDVHARIMLEIIFKGLMNEETLFVFGEPQQARDQTCDDIERRICSEFEDHGSQYP